MINGIIYKFTILTNKRFYVGQYSGDRFEIYWGSGKMWNNYLSNLKKKFPTCWKKLVRREILFSGVKSQEALDKLEEVYIRRENAHYLENMGGCNILKGTSNKFGSGSPMKDPNVADKVRKSLIKTYSEHPEVMQRIQGKRRWTMENTDHSERISKTLTGKLVGEKNPNYGHKWTDEMKRKQSEKMKGRYVGEKNPNYGKKWNAEQRKNLSDKFKNIYSGDRNPMFGKVRITNGIINTVIPKDSKLPDGFRYGMKRRKV